MPFFFSSLYSAVPTTSPLPSHIQRHAAVEAVFAAQTAAAAAAAQNASAPVTARPHEWAVKKNKVKKNKKGKKRTLTLARDDFEQHSDNSALGELKRRWAETERLAERKHELKMIKLMQKFLSKK